MLNEINLQKVLCIDIETVPQFPSMSLASEEAQALWSRKAAMLRRQADESAVELYHRAGIYAEFGKVVCISCGLLVHHDKREFVITSFCNDDESMLLNEFASFLNEFGRKVILCAHNGKEFDYPYLSRRMLINDIPLPSALQLAGRKPWEIQHLDTMELWKFGDYKNYTPLNLLAHVLSIPSPKEDIDGSMVHAVYWQERNLERIVKYCCRDVITVMQILLRLKGEPLLLPDEIKDEERLHL
jgi:3'-5' exonuclease